MLFKSCLFQNTIFRAECQILICTMIGHYNNSIFSRMAKDFMASLLPFKIPSVCLDNCNNLFYFHKQRLLLYNIHLKPRINIGPVLSIHCAKTSGWDFVGETARNCNALILSR
jgi:hypothetical protein